MKDKGKIQYYFKGITMSYEECVVKSVNQNTLIVERIVDNVIVEFTKHKEYWLLKGHDNKSLLYGTQFVFE
jgi:hypothetical protein